MRFAHPAALWLGLLAVPVVVLHLLRPRRTTRAVSSTLLWREVARPVSAASPWQRLRPSVLLALQLLAVALLAVGAARPVRVDDAALAQHTVFILDASGSMAALDGDPARIDAAKDRARELRGQLPAGGLASIVVASSRPRVVLSASPDGDAFADALGPVDASAGTADFAGAFTLAESMETPEAPIGFVLLSDGGLTTADRRQIPPGTRYERIGDRATNRAITRLVVEPRGSGLLARVTVANTGGGDARQVLRLDVDGVTAAEVPLELDGGTVVDREVELPGGDRVEAFLEGEDLLAADDRARAVAARRRALRVLVAGPDDVFLDRLLAAIPGVTVERSATSRPAPGYDLVIYDQVDVPDDPGAPFLALAPPAGAPGIAVTGAVDDPAVTLVQTGDPLLDGVDLSEVAIATAQRLTPAAGDDVLVGAEGAPLLVAGERRGRPFAYLAFRLSESNLPLQVAFPILGDRLVATLTGATLPLADLRVGDTLPLSAGPTGATVDAPGGTSVELAPGAAAPVADRPGFWVVREQGRADRVLAVNPAAEESRLAPADTLPIEPRPAVPGERRPSAETSLLRWVVAALLVVLALELLAARRRAGVPRRQWRAAVVLRAGVAVLLLLALADVAVTRTRTRVATMFLIDASDSLGAGGRADAVAWVRDALASQRPGDLAGVALFGGDARLELTVQERASLLQPATRIDPERTNLAGALRLAAAVLPSDARRRVVLVSDGRPTEGDAAEEARRLADSGIQLDVHTVGRLGGADAAVAALEAPGLARQGESVTLRATITATSAGPARLTLQRDGITIEERTVDLAAGETVVDLVAEVGVSGLERYRLEVATASDAVPENDVAFAAVQVEGPARVLVAEGTPGGGATLVDALRAGGLVVDVVDARALPLVEQLALYSSTVLVDVDARSLAPEQVQALAAATRDLGRGLVATGGDQSFALGGYLDSELEQLLPVVSDVLDPKRRDSVAEVLAIDSSGSMGACHCAEGANGMAGGNFGELDRGGVQKTDIARAASARAIGALSASDEIGVLAFNTEQRWVIDLQQLPSEEVVRRGLRGITPAGGTDVTDPLLEAAEALRASKAKLKHIILFTDGFTAPGALTGLRDQAADLAAEGITVSVLATGEGSAHELEAVAEAGNGRFYPGRDLEAIPEIMMEEAVIASRSFVNEGSFVPRVVSSAAPVAELRESPPLLGFLATTAKPAARTHLRIGEDDDPLLASWQAGLGRATAWTSDASDRWSQAWTTWEGYVPFWTAVVKDTFPTSTAGGAVRATMVGDTLRITAEAETPWPAGSTATARVAAPGGTSREVRLERTSGTTFVGEVPAGRAGSYAVGAAVRDGEEVVLSGATVASQSYSAEYRPGEPDPATMARLSAITGGRGAIEPRQAFEAADLPPGQGRIPLAGWLLVAAAVLFAFAVALSRLSFSGVAPVRAGRRLAGRLRSALPSLAALPGRPGGPAQPRAGRRRGRGPEPPVEPDGGPAPAAEQPGEAAAPAPAPASTTVGRLLERKREGRDP